MNESKLRQLFAAARREAAPSPPADFAGRVAAAVRREPPPAPPVTLAEQLALLFPRLAVAALIVLGLCVAAEVGHALMPGPDLTDGVTQLCGRWEFPGPGF